MKYTMFTKLAIVAGVLVLGGALYLCGHARRAPPAQVRTTAPPRAPEHAAPPAIPTPAVDHRAYLLGVLGKPASSDKIKDALGRGHGKVNVYAEHGVWARAKVDLNRNEKWDEKWWIEDGAIMRKVSPTDDESYGTKTREGLVESRQNAPE